MKKLVSKFLILALSLSLCSAGVVFANADASEPKSVLLQEDEPEPAAEGQNDNEAEAEPEAPETVAAEETQGGSSADETEYREETQEAESESSADETSAADETVSETESTEPAKAETAETNIAETNPAENETAEQIESESESETEETEEYVQPISYYGYTAPEYMSEAEVFDFLIHSKWPNDTYVTAVQAAAIMGNIEGEAGKGLNWGEKAYLIEGNYSSLGSRYRASGYINMGAFVYSVDHGIISKSDFCYSRYFGLNASYWSDVGAGDHSGHYGFGICQWTSTASGEKGALYDYCRSHGYSIGSVRGQLGFLMSNVKPSRFTGYWRGNSNANRYEIFMSTTSTDEAVEAFMNGYLRPASANHPGRYTSAARLYEEYAGEADRLVRELYQTCLDREPDAAELNSHVGALLRGDITAEQIRRELTVCEPLLISSPIEIRGEDVYDCGIVIDSIVIDSIAPSENTTIQEASDPSENCEAVFEVAPPMEPLHGTSGGEVFREMPLQVETGQCEISQIEALTVAAPVGFN